MNVFNRNIVIFIVLLLLTSAVFSQNTDSNLTVDTQDSNASISSSVDESELLLENDNNDTSEKTTLPATNWFDFLKMLLVLVIIAGCIYAILRVVKSVSTKNRREDKYLKILASTQLSPGRWLYVVSIGNEAFLLGSSESGITSIGNIGDKELIDTMKLHLVENPVENVGGFASLIQSFLKTGLKHTGKTQHNELAKQIDRLKKY